MFIEPLHEPGSWNTKENHQSFMKELKSSRGNTASTSALLIHELTPCCVSGTGVDSLHGLNHSVLTKTQ